MIILWFTKPYNMTEANELEKEFFRLFKKNFSPSQPIQNI